MNAQLVDIGLTGRNSQRDVYVNHTPSARGLASCCV